MQNVARSIEHVRRQPGQAPQQPAPRPRRQRGKITKGEKMLLGMLTVAFLLFIGFSVHNYATMYSVNREIHELEQTVAAQEQINDGLSLQVVELSSPERILKIAKSLGMKLEDENVKVVQN
ncbi:cell division protein FtsL [Halalkalibacterium halodurans]|jgi:cell division protein FtsL|uniref:Cell division protein FtsL n=2 Tax=Halalkalibacterium halodurans TaxID=86665 RepID=Q9K9S1_HALH5|nr:cell division protein FtsL [Halalkalibacterium halodurans]MDY7223110.1 cell division protein FtsL [Halalkalibacterium halodurans]MDY7242331.1 cell division protein FtsL [Halalkalibacterium halodurans]MED3646122.1 cell division protein FtsL [Halalkalibacterium halodurans]MED4079718.1 cell division protein FtsL [Halalkalibacterium halodurans]MED4086340.1 cell division protein FtsL [Halalkalibacterium halodurans]